jgi:hypothetical protein
MQIGLHSQKLQASQTKQGSPQQGKPCLLNMTDVIRIYDKCNLLAPPESL